jgi:hypothetical protein
MRWLIALVLMCSPALAEAWSQFESARFGFSIEVPSGFMDSMTPSDNGDGAKFASPDKTAELLIWGRNLDQTFNQDAVEQKRSEKADGWRITYSPVRRGKSYVLSGIKNDRIMYLKAVAACGGRLALAFRIEYPRAEKLQYDAMVTRLANSTRAKKGADCPEG